MYTPTDEYLKCEWCGRMINRDKAMDTFLMYGSRRVVFNGDRIVMCIDCAKEKQAVTK